MQREKNITNWRSWKIHVRSPCVFVARSHGNNHGNNHDNHRDIVHVILTEDVVDDDDDDDGDGEDDDDDDDDDYDTEAMKEI